jgi:hypothetical protein
LHQPPQNTWRSLAFHLWKLLSERRKAMRRISKLLAALFLIVNLAGACSTQKTVTTRYVQYDPRTGEPVTIEKETTTSTENSGAGGAVLSGTMSLLSTIILLPVRAVGVLIGAIL